MKSTSPERRVFVVPPIGLLIDVATVVGETTSSYLIRVWAADGSPQSRAMRKAAFGEVFDKIEDARACIVARAEKAVEAAAADLAEAQRRLDNVRSRQGAGLARDYSAKPNRELSRLILSEG